MKSIFLILFFLIFTMTAQAKEPSYKKVLKEWTRTHTVYQSSDFHVSILWNATLLNEEMINAMASYYQKTYNISDEERVEVMADFKQKQEGELLFFVSFYTSNRSFADIQNPRAHWDLRLNVGPHAYKPLRIEKVSKQTPLLQLYFPYLDQWSKGYYVWFPSESKSEAFELSIHGPQAHSELEWK